MPNRNANLTFINNNANYFATIFIKKGNTQEEAGIVDPGSQKSFATVIGEQWLVYAEDSSMQIGSVTVSAQNQQYEIVFPGGRGDLGQSGGTGGS